MAQPPARGLAALSLLHSLAWHKEEPWNHLDAAIAPFAEILATLRGLLHVHSEAYGSTEVNMADAARVRYIAAATLAGFSRSHSVRDHIHSQSLLAPMVASVVHANLADIHMPPELESGQSSYFSTIFFPTQAARPDSQDGQPAPRRCQETHEDYCLQIAVVAASRPDFMPQLQQQLPGLGVQPTLRKDLLSPQAKSFKGFETMTQIVHIAAVAER